MIIKDKFLGLVSMSLLTQAGMFVLALAAIVASGMSTYDIAYNLSPKALAIFVAWATVVVIDGGYLFLDIFFPWQKTQTARTLIGLFMAALWCMMVATNITDAVWRNNVSVGGYVVYGVKIMGLIWVLVYTFIRFDDPETKKILQKTEIEELHDRELLAREKEYATLIAPLEAKALAIANLADRFQQRTGKQIETVLGKDWAKVHLGQEDQAPAGSDAAGPKSGKKLVVPVPAPVEDQGLVARLRNSLNIKTTNPTTPQGQ